MKSSSAPADDIARTARLFCAPEVVVELRAVKCGKLGTISGYFDNPDDLATQARSLDANASVPSTYVTLNPLNPDLLARCVNRVKRNAIETSSDRDATGRRWVLIDADPVRPAGISSTEEEHHQALARAEAIADFLDEAGWPAPVRADSGNGAHLLYRIDLPNDAETLKLVTGALEAIAQRFDDDFVKVDRKVGNAARITKFYGTVTRKGDDTPSRPHRRSRLLQVPEPLGVVTGEQLAALAQVAPSAPARQDRPASRSDRQLAPFDVPAFLSRNNLEVIKEGPYDGGHRWNLAVCPWNSDHTDKSAWILQKAGGELRAGCSHNSCSGYEWADLRAKFEPRPEPTVASHKPAPERAEVKSEKPSSASGDGKPFDVRAYAERHDLHIVREERGGRGAVKFVLQTCPWGGEEHGELAYIERYSQGGVGAGCAHPECAGKKWVDLRAVIKRPKVKNGAREGSKPENLPESDAAHAIASKIKGRHRFHHATENWYAYDKALGVWSVIQKTIMLAVVQREIDAQELAPEGYSISYVNSVVGLLRAHLEVFEWSKTIGFANGVMVGGQLRRHAPDNLLLHALPYPYDPTATCQPVIDWLMEAQGGDAETVHVLRCYMNAIVNGRADIQVFLELVGPGGAGKGTFMRLCWALVGKHSSVATELKRLETIRFEPARLRDKLLVQINDSDKYGGEVSMLKRFTGGDDIPHEEKNKQAGEDFRASGMAIITANQPIKSSDYTSGLSRRRITIGFSRQVEMDEAQDLGSKFAPFMSGVYNWVNSLDPDLVTRDLRRATTHVPAIAKLRQEVEEETNPIAGWALARLYYLPGAGTKVGMAHYIPAKTGTGSSWGANDDRPGYYLDHETLLYASYRQWCHGNGLHKHVSHVRFSKDLVDLLANQYKLPMVFKKDAPGGKGAHVYGVTLSADAGELGQPEPLAEARERVRTVRVLKTTLTAEDRALTSNCVDRDDREDINTDYLHARAHDAHVHAGEITSEGSQGTHSSQAVNPRVFEAREGDLLESSHPHAQDEEGWEDA